MLFLRCSCCAFALLYPFVIPTPNAAEESGTFRSSCHSDANAAKESGTYFDRLVIPTPKAEESATPRSCELLKI
jgi:hypothetical protein